MALPARKPSTVFPPWLLIGVAVICAGIALWLIPTERGLLERQLADKAWGNALKTLNNLPERERARHARRYALLEIDLERRLLAKDDPLALRTLLARACKLAASFKFDPAFMESITALLDQVQDPEAAFKLLGPSLPLLPIDVRPALYEALVKKALAAAKPVLAMQIYAEYWQSNPTEAATLKLIALTRQAGQPALGLRVVDEFARRAGRPLVRVSPRLAWERITLLRETGQPGEAYGAIRELMAVVEAPERERLFGLLVSTARESSRLGELLPEIQKRALVQPENAQLWRMLAELALAGGDQKGAMEALRRIVALEPNDRSHHLHLAQLYEWNAAPNDAFDQYLIALRLKEPAAIERLIALVPGLYRDADLAKALAEIRAQLFHAGIGILGAQQVQHRSPRGDGPALGGRVHDLRGGAIRAGHWPDFRGTPVVPAAEARTRTGRRRGSVSHDGRARPGRHVLQGIDGDARRRPRLLP